MSEKLHSVWPILAHDGVGDAIGDARPAFAVTPDGRFLHFANAAGARFLGLAPARTLEARLSLEPRLADRLARFAAVSRPGETTRELVRFFDGLRSSLLSLGLRRLTGDAIFVTVDNARTVTADADPAASLAAVAAEGGLVALFDADGEVVVALGDHAALDGVQDEIEAALDADGDDAVFERRVETGGRAHDLALVRLGSGDHPRRLLRVGPAETLATPAAAPATPTPDGDAASPASVADMETVPSATAAGAEIALPVSVTAAEIALPASAGDDKAARPASAGEGIAAQPAPAGSPELPEPVVPPHPVATEEITEDLAEAIAAVTGTTPAAEAPPTDEIDAPRAAVTTATTGIAPLAAASPAAPDETALATATPLAALVETAPAIATTATAIGGGLSTTADDETETAEDEAAIGETVVADTTAAPLDTDDTGEIDETASADIATAATAPAAFRHRSLGRAVKFVWQMDAERRFTLVSDELAEVVGPRAAAILGRSWREVADDFGLDSDGRVEAALNRRDTWSGRTVSWPVEGEALRLPVDLAALPAFDRGRVFTGYRGFGTVRGDEPLPDPTGTGLRLAATAATAAIVEAPARPADDTPAPPTTTAPALLAGTAATAVDTEIPPVAEAAIDDPSPDRPTSLLATGAAVIATGAVSAVASHPATPDDAVDAEPAAATTVAAPAPADGSADTRVVADRCRPAEPPIDEGEAAFAGEIEAEPTHRPPPPSTLPDVWFDDELALAMATLPVCGEDATAEDDDTAAPSATGAPLATVETTGAEAIEPAIEITASAPLALAAIVAEPAPPATEATDLTAIATATPGPNEAAPRPGEPPADTDEALAHGAVEALAHGAVEALAHGAVEARRAAEALFAADTDEAPVTTDHAPAASPASSRDARLAQAPAALRAAVAEIEARAAALEPRIVLPTREPVETSPAEPEAAPPSAATVEPTPTVDPAPHTEHTVHTASPAPDLVDVTAHPTPVTDAGAPTVAATPAEPLVAPDAAAPDAPATIVEATPPSAEPDSAPTADTRIVALAATTRPPTEAIRLSQPERVAFRQIAEALGARIEGEDRPATTGATEPTRPADEAGAAGLPAAGRSGRRAPDSAKETDAAERTEAHETRLLDRLPNAVAVVKDDSLAYGNDAFLRLLGYPDLATLEAEGGLDALFAGEHVARRWKAGPDGSRPVPVLARDGRVIPVDAQVATVPWGRGSALMLTLSEVEAPEKETSTAEADEPAPDAAAAAPFAALTDATPPTAPGATLAARAAAFPDAGLRDRVAELEAIIDTATDGVLMLDGEGTILSANHAAEALFGTDRADMIGRPLADRLAPESRRSAMDYLDGLARNGVASVLNDGREVIGVVERGGLIPLFMTIGRISADPARKYCAVLRDITHWKKSEEDLTAARRRAEEASVHKSDFLAKISHEIRTPLNAIIGFSEVMMDERFGPVGNDRYKDYLRDIHSSGSHIMSLINDLLDLSKVEAGKMDLRFEAVTLADIMSECVAMMQPQANRERIIIRSSLPAGVPPVVADPRSVRQVVLNLLSNAIKFTPSGGQVIVSTTLEDSGEVVMRVRDTGYGMTEKELQTAMEPFRQLHTTRSRGGGTGLGLPLTKALVEANRAVLRIDSTVGQGTLVTVTFPVTRVLAG